MSDTEVFEHESYGMISISRLSGDGTAHLFGSSIEQHYTLMQVELFEAERHHHLAHDSYYARKPIFRVVMTAAQFAEFVTSANGSYGGVPCTIRMREGKQVEQPPRTPTEAEKVRSDFKVKTDGLAKKMRERRKSIAVNLEKLGKKAQAEILGHLDMMIQDVESNLPFVVDQFEEAADRIVTASKLEIDAFMTTALHSAGLAALKDGTGAEERRLLLERMNTPGDEGGTT